MSPLLTDGRIGPITQTDIVRFAGAGGDFNPLHHDPESARRAGFDAPIAMGQFTIALLSAWLTDQIGVEHMRSLDVDFKSPVRIGDTVDFTAEFADDEQDGLTRAELSATVGQTVVAAGTTTFAADALTDVRSDAAVDHTRED